MYKEVRACRRISWYGLWTSLVEIDISYASIYIYIFIYLFIYLYIYIYLFIYLVSFRSGCTDCHQSLDAILEEDNRTCKVWVWGELDADVWRSVVRNHDALMMLREKTLAVMALVEPKSESRARVHPSYD